MANEVAVLWVVISGIIGLVVGLLAAYASIRSGALQKGKVAELESQLSGAQQELSDYKQQVFNQFSDTADKFRALDESYHALHRQLAESSVALCGDQAAPMLTADTAPQVLPQAEDDVLPGEDPGEPTVADTGEDEAQASASQPEEFDEPEKTVSQDIEPDAAEPLDAEKPQKETLAAGESDSATARDAAVSAEAVEDPGKDNIVIAEPASPTGKEAQAADDDLDPAAVKRDASSG